MSIARLQTIVDAGARRALVILNDDGGTRVEGGELVADGLSGLGQRGLDAANDVVPDFIVEGINQLGAANRSSIQRSKAADYVRTEVHSAITALYWVRIADDMKARGLGSLLSMLSGRGWLDWAGSSRAQSEAKRLLRDSRALERWRVQGPGDALDGEAWRALNLYAGAAYPIQILNPTPPQSVVQSRGWRVLLQVHPNMARMGPVLGGIEVLSRSGVPNAAAGIAKIRQTYAAELRFLGAELSLGQGANAQQSARGSATRQSVPAWPSAKLPQGLAGISPATGRVWIAEAWFEMSVPQRVAWLKKNGLPVEYAYADGQARYKNTKTGGGTLTLIAGTLALTGLGTAAVLKLRKRPRRRIRKGRRK